MDAVRKVLSKTHLQEALFKFMMQLRQQQKRKVTFNVPTSHQFEVPATENGFVFISVSLCDRTFSTFHLAETDSSLSEALRSCNSTRDDALIENQPWAMGLFIWFSSMCATQLSECYT